MVLHSLTLLIRCILKIALYILGIDPCSTRDSHQQKIERCRENIFQCFRILTEGILNLFVVFLSVSFLEGLLPWHLCQTFLLSLEVMTNWRKAPRLKPLVPVALKLESYLQFLYASQAVDYPCLHEGQ